MLTTIRADGIDWPVETYLDAYRMVRVDRFDPPRIDDPTSVRVVVLTCDGELLPPRTADAVIWGDVIAFRPLEGTAAAAECEICGERCLNGAFESRAYDFLCAGCEPGSWYQ